MEERNDAEYEIDLLEILSLLKSKVLYIVAAALVAGLVAFLVTAFFITPQYEASVNMIVNTRQDSSAVVTNDSINSAKNLVPTYAIIIKSNIVMNEVIDKLGLNTTADALSKKISVSSVDNTQVMKIAMRDPEPQKAKDIIALIAEIAPEHVIQAVEAGSCKVVNNVSVSENPVSPNTVKNTMLGVIVGVFISIAAIIIASLTNKYIVDDDDVQKYLGLPVIGVIPDIDPEKIEGGSRRV